MLLRWVRRQLMWRLRNRLIVTYVFIGVIPIILLVTMALLAGYLFAGQFATYVAMSDLQSELQHLESANRSLAMQFRSLARSEKLNEQLAAEIASASDENFRNRVVSVWDGDKPFVLSAGRPASGIEPIQMSPAIQGDFAGFVLDGKRLHLRVVKHVEAGSHHLTVISNVPITPQLLRMATSQLGSVTVLPPDEDTKPEPASCVESLRSHRLNPLRQPDKDNDKLIFRHGKFTRDGEPVWRKCQLDGWRRDACRRLQTASTCTFPLPLASAPSTGTPANP